MSELKCCPFCGGEAKMDSGVARDRTQSMENPPLIGYCFVRCLGCGVDKGYNAGTELEAVNHAVYSWNTRPVDLSAQAANAVGHAKLLESLDGSASCLDYIASHEGVAIGSLLRAEADKIRAAVDELRATKENP